MANSTIITTYLGADVAANRPASPAVPGSAFFFATDTGVLSVWNGSAWSNVSSANLKQATIPFIIGDGVNTITTGLKGYLAVDFAGTINAATLLGDATGSIVVDIWKCTYSQFDAGATHPVSGDKITSSTPPTISSATKSQDTTLASWTTSFSAGDIFAFNVNSVTTLKRCTVGLKVTKS